MTHTPLPSDKFQVRQRPELNSPANCSSCGNGTCREGYVDPQVFYEYEGNVYFCIPCAKELAQAIGCLTPEESAFLEEQNLAMAKELKELKEAHGTALSRLTIYDSVVAAVGSGTSTRDILESVEQVEQGDIVNSSGASDARKPVAKKSVKGPGRANPERTTVRNGLNL